tara:strand:+ start:1238 stop:2530 length:1293 start_codon:yes stop_codon:yes gene_type:complete
LLVLTFTAQVAWSSESSNTAHRLLLLKSNLENGFGLERMECYPFISKIGFTEDQKPLIANCLQTAIQLKKALEIRGLKDLRVVGFDSRSFRTGGFSSVLIRVSADSNEILKFLESPLTLVEQQKFLNEVNEVKQFILDKINVRDLYCTQRISNNECLTGYKTLAKVLKNTLIKNKQWNEVIITNSYSPLENPSALPLKFDAEEDDMRKQVALRDMMELWDKRQDLYEIIEERYGDWFHKKLKLFKFLCAIDLSDDECLKGAANFYLAAPKLRDRLWSRVVVTRYNTQILDDYNARVRFDLEPDEIIRHFSQKPPRKETQTNQILVEKLEGRTKNNPSGLRVVCDLEGMRSELCVRGFNLFIEFMEKHRRKFVADPRWETLMWIDGNQLERVNFALNSASRPSYLYADANASVKEVEHYLMQFGKIFEEKD